MRSERGAATVEWTGLVLLVAVVLGGGLWAAGLVDGTGLARRLRCAIAGAACERSRPALQSAYGAEVAGLVRDYGPGIVYERGARVLPVDFRRCRSRRCSDAPDRRGMNVWSSSRGERATVFTRVVDRRAAGGDLFIQYWMYFPDSTWNRTAHRVSQRGGQLFALTPAGMLTRRVAGHHRDDWENYQVRIAADGSVHARAGAHHGYAGRNEPFWRNVDQAPDVRVPRVGVVNPPRRGHWVPATGWTRVSAGSHAGHVPDGPRRDRWTEPDAVELVPLERLSSRDRSARFAIPPPWRKPVYTDPEWSSS
jgi:hypothetical protein